MNRLKMALFPCVLITVLATFLLRPVVAQAVIPGACGGWSIVPSPNVPSRENYFSGVAAVSANDVWAVGADSRQGGNAIFTLIEHWNGTQWSIVASPGSAPFIELVGVVALSAQNVWAVGSIVNNAYLALIEHWDGTKWSVVPNIQVPASNWLELQPSQTAVTFGRWGAFSLATRSRRSPSTTASG